jgi:hypothetical protein
VINFLSLDELLFSFSYFSPSLVGSHAVYPLCRPNSDPFELVEALLLPSNFEEGLIEGRSGPDEGDVSLPALPGVLSLPQPVLLPILLQILV